MTTGIYEIVHTSGKRYVGQSINIETRFAAHIVKLAGNKHKNQFLQNAFNKYGAAAFSFTIVNVCDRAELDAQEQLRMNAYPQNMLYNLAPVAGSNAGYRHTEQSRANMSAAQQLIVTPERRARLSAVNLGRTQSPEVVAKRVAKNIGKKRTDATRAAIGKAHTGKIVSEETRQLLRDREISPETRAKISAAAIARGPLSDEHKRKIGAAGRGVVRSAESKERYAAAATARWNDPAWKTANACVAHTDETRAKMRETKIRAENPGLTEAQVKAIVELGSSREYGSVQAWRVAKAKIINSTT